MKKNQTRLSRAGSLLLVSASPLMTDGHERLLPPSYAVYIHPKEDRAV